MNPTRARKRIRELARAGAWELSQHAEERMVERNVEPWDVYAVLTGAEDCRALRPGARKPAAQQLAVKQAGNGGGGHARYMAAEAAEVKAAALERRTRQR